ncbi:hypothetical protein AB6A40_005018 [Gnathostoma spinigerum]|uniref:Endonuclease/exonuclease/phosphatase domain-containing protein n=1 Tax=Gnathostoma spinigerum TaxID=75299 RepID=A0ABD6EJI1_9BILA
MIFMLECIHHTVMSFFRPMTHIIRVRHSTISSLFHFRKYSSIPCPQPELVRGGVTKAVNRTMLVPQNILFVWHDTPSASSALSRISSEHRILNSDDAPMDVSVLFNIQLDAVGKNLLVALRRPHNERFIRTVKRIEVKMQKALSEGSSKMAKKGKKNTLSLSHSNLPEELNVQIDGISPTSLAELSNEDVFFSQGIEKIKIGFHELRIVRDSPDCSGLTLKLDPKVGFPLIASYDLRAGIQQHHQPVFHWFVAPGDVLLSDPVVTSNYPRGFTLPGWTFRHKGTVFYPTSEDVGRHICVLADFGVDSIVRAAVSENVITAEIAEPFVFEGRQSEYCAEPPKNGIRVMSYNILADLYLNLKLDQSELFFPYCPKEYQSYSYRYPLLLKEIPGYNADLVFLQEVDFRFYLRYLPQVLASFGYECSFRIKEMLVNEGLAICYRKSQFRLMSVNDAWLPDLLNPVDHPENADVFSFVESDEGLKEKFVTRPTVVQLIVLKYDSKDENEALLLCANTHLHYDPRHENIKVLQSLLCTRHVAKTAHELQISHPNAKIQILFCGDFNSTPGGGVYELMSSGKISADHRCWYGDNVINVKGAAFAISNDDAVSSEQSLFNLQNLSGNPPVSNYTLHTASDGTQRGFAGCLDYIWGNPCTKVLRVIPMPSESLVKKYEALPSKLCPSDHLPLICEVELN